MKKIFIITQIILTLGWVPFMLLAIWTDDNSTIRLALAFGGFIICLSASAVSVLYLRDNNVLKSIDKLNEEREEYYRAKKRYIIARKKLEEIVLGL